jgi:hypothetical protein
MLRGDHVNKMSGHGWKINNSSDALIGQVKVQSRDNAP